MTAASAASVVQPSSLPSVQSPSSLRRWSSTQRSSNPAASAWTTASRSSGQPVRWTQNAAPNRISIARIVRTWPTSHEPVRASPPEARDAILAWYDATGRQLAFRSTADPYAVLVSRADGPADAGGPGGRGMDGLDGALADGRRRWPRRRSRTSSGRGRASATTGARSTSTARRRRSWSEHGGAVPSRSEELEALPGVGPYTARAVAAIAFRAPVGAVDTNVRRVLGRIAAGGPRGVPGRVHAGARGRDRAAPTGRTPGRTR